jgi:AcrR family transcriptional regulator
VPAVRADPSHWGGRAGGRILDAALSLTREHGYARLTMDAIAAAARVGKPTIYRSWHSKAAVVLDAFASQVGEIIPFPDTGDVAGDLRAQVSAAVRLLSDPLFGPVYAGLIAESQHDPVLADALYDRLIRQRISACAKRLAAGQDAGQVAAGIDLDVAAELLYGPVYHRLLLHSGPLSEAHAGATVDLVIGGLTSSGGQRPSDEPPSGPAGADSQPATVRAPGPRSRDAILAAAYDLCAAGGFRGLAMEAIAARAGVGKQTIYRWWPSKGAVVLDALTAVMPANTAYPDTGDVRADLRKRMQGLVPLYTSQGFWSVYVGVIAAAQFDDSLAADLSGRLIGPRMAACSRRLAGAQAVGQIDPALEPGHITELLYGAVHHRLLLHGRPLTIGYVGQILDLAFRGIRAGCDRPDLGS